MTRFALTIEFDGTPFLGLQRQPNGPTVQGTIEAAILAVTGEAATLHAAGRTDAGVHALGMRAHFDIAKAITPFRLMQAINALVRPAPIAVLDCAEVPADWHSRFSCTGREYLYRIANRRAPLTLERNRAWHLTQELDAPLMQRAAQLLVGSHDFTTFRSAHCQSASPVKTLDRLEVRRATDSMGREHVLIEAAARSFLHHQVRSMVGCLAMVGMGKWSEQDLSDALEARDRQRLGFNAPPHGLYFVHALYPGE